MSGDVSEPLRAHDRLANRLGLQAQAWVGDVSESRIEASYNLRFTSAESAWHPARWLPSSLQGTEMKDGIHPGYRDVCFVDLSNGFKFVTRPPRLSMLFCVPV